MGFSNTIAIANANVGVGKTSTVANLGGLAAAAGLRALVIDLDVQANLGSDLGLLQRAETDDGAGLIAAVADGRPLEALPSGRPDLDVVTAGAHTASLEALLEERGVATLYWALEALVRTYDLVLVDTPPTLGSVAKAALTIADHLLVPVRSTSNAPDELSGLSDLFLEVRDGDVERAPTNPNLEVVGVFLHAVDLGAAQAGADAAARLRADIGEELSLRAAVRRLDEPVLEMQASGELAHEYEAVMTAELQARLVALSRGDRPTTSSRAPAVTGLVDDYRQLFGEVIARLTADEARRRAA